MSIGADGLQLIRDRRRPSRVEDDFLVSVGLVYQCPQQKIVELVPGLESGKLADQAPEQIEIADGVEHFVSYELVLEPEDLAPDSS